MTLSLLGAMLGYMTISSYPPRSRKYLDNKHDNKIWYTKHYKAINLLFGLFLLYYTWNIVRS